MIDIEAFHLKTCGGAYCNRAAARSWGAASRGAGRGFSLVMVLPRVNGHAYSPLATIKRFSHGLWIALLLTLLGLLAYASMTKAVCSPTSQYIHAAIRGAAQQVQRAAARTAGAAAAAAAHLEASKGVMTSEDVISGLLSGLLQPDESTPAFLDAAVQAGMNNTELRRMMQLQQDAFCLGGHHKIPLPGSVAVPFSNVSVYVYGAGDIVSDHLKGAQHGWENVEIQEWLWAIRQWQQQPEALPAASTNITRPDRPLTVDIGSNLGWFSLNAAAAGARVAAFEAMPSNIALIRRSLCASPWLAERIALYGTGLAETAGACYIISGTGNRGDGFIMCDKERAYNTSGYEVRGMIPLRRLDTLLSEDVQVLKIDVEGYEQKVLTGAKGLLTQHKVHYIMAECNTGIIGEEAGKKFIQFLHEQGYDVSPMSFRGPFWDANQIPTASCTNINLYARRRAGTA